MSRTPHLPTITENLEDLYNRFEQLGITHLTVHLYLESWFTCMFAKVHCEWYRMTMMRSE